MLKLLKSSCFTKAFINLYGVFKPSIMIFYKLVASYSSFFHLTNVLKSNFFYHLLICNQSNLTLAFLSLILCSFLVVQHQYHDAWLVAFLKCTRNPRTGIELPLSSKPKKGGLYQKYLWIIRRRLNRS